MRTTYFCRLEEAAASFSPFFPPSSLGPSSFTCKFRRLRRRRSRSLSQAGPSSRIARGETGNCAHRSRFNESVKVRRKGRLSPLLASLAPALDWQNLAAAPEFITRHKRANWTDRQTENIPPPPLLPLRFRSNFVECPKAFLHWQTGARAQFNFLFGASLFASHGDQAKHAVSVILHF